MPEQLPNEAKVLLAQMLFKAQATPGLYVGLTTVEPVMSADLKTATMQEPVNAEGYQRAALEPADWELQMSPPGASSDKALFKNTGSRAWSTVRGAFLSTSEDDSGHLVYWMALRAPRMLLEGDVLKVPITVRI